MAYYLDNRSIYRCRLLVIVITLLFTVFFMAEVVFVWESLDIPVILYDLAFLGNVGHHLHMLPVVGMK